MNISKLYQILDANINRLTEGLRVLEEITRFSLSNKETTIKLKNFRHEIVTLYKSLPNSKSFINSRDTGSDPGKELNRKSELTRDNLQAIINSNSGRIKESLRVLEEFTKLLDKKISMQFKKARFDFYDIEKEVLQNSQIKKMNLNLPQLYPIIDLVFCKDLKMVAEILNDAGIKITQLRVKHETDLKFFKAAELLKRLLNPEITLLINNRIDIASAVDADGVHLGQSDIPQEQARKLISSDKLIGISVNNIRESSKAVKLNADYLGFGPMYFTETKKDAGEIKSLKLLKNLNRLSPIPIATIGGITPENTLPLLQNGGKLIAVISSIFNTKNPDKIIKKFNLIIRNFSKEKIKAV
ncbi:MAG: thiamine phosphate synthase [bacterium]|nr:thiamine phosphate synthase [bacterium]